MKQTLQNLGSGEIKFSELTAPSCPDGSLGIQTIHSLISVGTEKMLVEFSNVGQRHRRLALILAKKFWPHGLFVDFYQGRVIYVG